MQKHAVVSADEALSDVFEGAMVCSGGFGPIAERDPGAIGRDLLDGYVSVEQARRDYHVADPEALRRAAASEDLT